MTSFPSRGALPPPRLRTAVAVACFAAVLAACGGGHDADPADTLLQRVAPALDDRTVAAPASGRLAGQVLLDAPVAGAEVVLRAPDGGVLARATTNANGAFLMKLPARLPRDFTVAVEANGASLAASGTLLLVQDDFEAVDGSVRVNLPTTLAAHVLGAGLQRRADYTPAQASADVRRYLGLPPGWDLRDGDTRQFDAASFLRAQQGASLDDALPRLAARIVDDATLTEPYRGVLLGGSPEDDALDAAISVSRYGLEYLSRFDHPVTERISGWGLAAVNWLKPDYGARFDQIDRKLDEMHADVTVIQRQVLALQGQMRLEFERVEQALDALDDRIAAASLTNAYVTLNNNIALAHAQIVGLQRTYEDHLALGYEDDETPELLDKLADNIIAVAPAAIEQLMLAQVGTGSSMTSAAAVWHRLQAIGTPQYPLAVGSAFFDAINQQQDHVAGLQVLALNLLMDAYNYKANRNRTPDVLDNLPANVAPRARRAFATFAPIIEQTQNAVAYPRIDPGLVANLQSGRLHVRHAAAMRLDQGCTRLHLAWQEGAAPAREFRSPASDCDFRFANATPAFNAMRPFGFSDWSVGELPVFRWERGTTNLAVAQSLGYDFSAIYGQGSDARASYVIGVEGGAANLRWGFRSIGTFGYFSPPLTALRQLEPTWGGWHNVFFSRPIKPDPVARGCTMTDGWTMRCKFA